MKILSFDLIKKIEDTEKDTKENIEDQINKKIDEITELNNLEYVLDGQYKIPEDRNEDEIINKAINAVKEDNFLSEYINVSVWQLVES